MHNIELKSSIQYYLLVPIGSHGYYGQYYCLNRSSTEDHSAPNALMQDSFFRLVLSWDSVSKHVLYML